MSHHVRPLSTDRASEAQAGVQLDQRRLAVLGQRFQRPHFRDNNIGRADLEDRVALAGARCRLNPAAAGCTFRESYTPSAKSEDWSVRLGR